MGRVQGFPRRASDRPGLEETRTPGCLRWPLPLPPHQSPVPGEITSSGSNRHGCAWPQGCREVAQVCPSGSLASPHPVPGISVIEAGSPQPSISRASKVLAAVGLEMGRERAGKGLCHPKHPREREHRSHLRLCWPRP